MAILEIVRRFYLAKCHMPIVQVRCMLHRLKVFFDLIGSSIHDEYAPIFTPGKWIVLWLFGP